MSRARDTDAVSPYAAPARAADLSGLPPTFIDVGSAETFRDEDVAYATRIWQSGGRAELHVWPGGFHGFETMAPDSALSVRACAHRPPRVARTDPRGLTLRLPWNGRPHESRGRAGALRHLGQGNAMSEFDPENALTVRIGDHELVIRRRYEALSILNDILIALWFIAGSIMFFSQAWTTTGTWCFLLGSIELMIRPVIRLSRHLHLQSLRSNVAGGGTRGGQDY